MLEIVNDKIKIESPVKVLFLNSSDTHGGAARSAYRLFVGLRTQGVSVKMIVRDKKLIDPDIISCSDFESKGLKGKLDKFVWKIKNRIRKQKWKKYPDREPVFLNDLDSISLLKAIQSIDFDILHLHFIANRFLDINELNKINKPIVWTLHDSWAFTGICHFFYECKRYEQSCGSCPMLHSDNPNDFTHKIWKTKQKVYSQCNIHLVTPSKWIGTCATQSSLFRNFPLKVIPNGINTQSYQPFPKYEARQTFGLDIDKSYILFGAVNATTDVNKGFHFLIEAIKIVSEKKSFIELLIFGAEKPDVISDFGFPIHYMGVIKDEKTLVKLYNASDIMVVPSLSEVFGQTASEAMACGIPAVAFNCSGLKEVIEHKQTGYLAKPYNTQDLASGILWCLENNVDKNLSVAARKRVENNFGLDNVVLKYMEVYKDVLRG